MSKSAGNFFTVRDIIKRYDPQVLRMFMLSAHYRSPLNFSDDLMEAAKAGYERIVTCVSNLNFMLEKDRAADMTAQEQELLKQALDMRGRFESVMEDDFNTADAISVIFDLVRFANSNTNEESARTFLEALRSEIIELAGVCGLIVERREELQDAEIEQLIADRQKARKDKDFARADEIRMELLEKGIVLEDTREGVKWKKA